MQDGEKEKERKDLEIRAFLKGDSLWIFVGVASVVCVQVVWIVFKLYVMHACGQVCVYRL